MANKEVCEVFIEQQIEEGLQEGKTPYSIGKELSSWVEKLFKAKIPATTVEKRAERVKAKNSPTNVGNDLTPQSETGKEDIQDFKMEDVKESHGGAREGAGRPKRNKVTDAFTYIEFAKSQVERIRLDDPERVTAIRYFIDYLEALLKKGE